MAEDRKIHVLSYEVWQQLEPLIEAARPPHRTDHVDLRQTIEAIIWRHQNGTKWRAIPLDLGGTDLHPLEPPRRLGPHAHTGAGARPADRDELP
jgi:transposase